MKEPEKDDGNIEYKRILKNDDEDKIQNLASQMAFRCSESEMAECVYNLGVADNGEIIGLTDEEYKKTIDILTKVAEKNNYSVTLLTTTTVDGSKDKNIYEVLIREINENKYIDIKVCVAGNVDSGKSSIVGSLITGIDDDGRGLARSSVFNFVHELKSGRTSSIAHHILGFDYDGKIVNYQSVNKMSWGNIVQKSAKVISFFDLAGHSKYLKTTILGLASSFPDICFIMVAANNGISTMTKEHIILCMTLNIPFVVIISKIDICKDRKNILDETVASVNKILRSSVLRRIPVTVRNMDDIMLCVKNIYTFSMTPVFHISCVTGEGLDLLKTFLNVIGKKETKVKTDGENIVEFHVDHVFSVSGFGTVLGGNLLSGEIKVGDKLLIGPNLGIYEPLVIRSIFVKRVPMEKVLPGSYTCLGIKKLDMKIRRGHVVISPNSEKIAVKTFKAKVNILRTHSSTIKVGYEPVLTAYSIRKVVKITDIAEKKSARRIKSDCSEVIDDKCLRNDDSAIVTFIFKTEPQFMKIGTKFILSEGKTKIVGETIEIL